MTETLTQKSHRKENANWGIVMLKTAIVKNCHTNRWRGGVFESFKSLTSDVDIDLEWLAKSLYINEPERAIFQDTRLKVADLRAYLEGRPTNLSNVDDIGWVKRLNIVFEDQIGKDQIAGRVSTVQKGAPGTKPGSSEADKDGFERQKVYGGSGGPPKE